MKAEVFGWRDGPEQPVALTPWSVVHMLSGGAMRSVGMSQITANLFHGAYEIKDAFFTKDRSKVNGVFDQIMCNVGWHVMKSWSRDAAVVSWIGLAGLFWLLRLEFDEKDVDQRNKDP